LPSETPLHDFVSQVSKALNCNGVRFADAGKPACRVAVGGGACGDYADQAAAAGCDTFVTSDLSYHQFLDAAGKGINLVDAGHFPTEDPVCNQLISFLTAQFPELTVSKSTSHREVIQYYVEGEINHVRTF
jgi:putative NIF3 family GTP cyclohydrolase 1 type 2